jgi:hypothetical protein
MKINDVFKISIIHHAVSFLFLVECMLKIYSLGLHRYLIQVNRKLEFVIVLFALVIFKI